MPTLNAERWLPRWLEGLARQTVRPEQVVLVDSQSTDRTQAIAAEAGLNVIEIERANFSHGGTRQRTINQFPQSEIAIFLTQDAILASPDSLERLLRRFDDPKMGAAYGRQLPRENSDPIEAHARLFNYPAQSDVRSIEDIPRLGLKTSFISNSFAAWRIRALNEVGGFPDHTIQNEDAWAASKLIKSGWKLAYCADATVVHSHRMSIAGDFKRYFDTGVFHAQAPWIRDQFGGANGEGARFVKSEINHLLDHQPTRIGSALVRTGVKLVGFKLGCVERKLPLWLKERCSSNRNYWKSHLQLEGEN